MVPVALSDVVAVGEMPTAAQIKILAAAGFKSILNTQPDGEVPRLLTASYAHVLSMARNLAYRHIPIESRRPTDEQISAISSALGELPRPIYACCYSGSRTAAAWALAAAPHMEAEDVIRAVENAGFNIEFLRDALIARRASAIAVDGASATLSKTAAAPQTLVPTLLPKLIFPSAASEGGYARSG
jgi:uncharacterized protein (TIGR01244 family)